ncbi:MAG: Gfo/Idh/MocA family oxidoreductase [Provencibacterium sp.]|jgi:UDP-N-acetyl-2-amino-2-deoxyglucuronate dehydrogenase|nr:Gfo/Idh/MocA family oxidoreductase [Provencibacterium sp.]
MKNGKLQAAILGCGTIGNLHARAILANPALVGLYGVCDLIPERAQEYQEKYGAEHIYMDLQELLADPQVDIVHICTPSGYHAEHAIACAHAGKHILCEKPLDISKEKMSRMIEAFEGTSLKAAAVFQYRTYPGVQEAKRLIDSGALGRILVANARYQQYRSPEYYRSAGWRGTWEIDGGGSTMNQGIHIMDILCYLTGGARSILAKAPTLARDIAVEDVSCAIMSFHSGAIGTYQATTLADPPVCIMAELFCEKGRLVFDPPGVTLYTQKEPQGRPLGDDPAAGDFQEMGGGPLDIGAVGHARLVENLAHAIRGEEEVFIPIHEGRRSVDTILALYESHRTGKEVLIG